MQNKVIWHISSNRWNSAITEYALSMIRGLNCLGLSNIFSPLASSPAAFRAARYGIECYPLPRFDLLGIRDFLDIFHQIQPQCVVVYDGAEEFLSRFLIGKKKPTIIRFFGRSVKPPAFLPLRYSCLLAHIDGYLFPSQRMYNVYKLYPKFNTKIIPFGSDPGLFNTKSSRLKNQRPVLTVLGRLDPVKGQREFLCLFTQILKQWPFEIPRPFLQIIGEPANLRRSDLEDVASRLGLQPIHDYSILDQRVDDIAQMLRNSDVGVICSLDSEIICRVGVEFLLSGTPILVSGVGSLGELIEEPFGFDYGTLPSDELVSKMSEFICTKYLESDEIRTARGILAESHYTMIKMAEKFSAYLNEM